MVASAAFFHQRLNVSPSYCRQGLNLKKRVWLTLASVATASIVILAAFLASAATDPQGQVVGLPRLEPRYLVTPPFYPDNAYKTTKIYLTNASCYEGSSLTNEALKDLNFNVGADAYLVLVNGTIRNDYTTEEIIALSHEGVSDIVVGLDIYLYDEQGNFVNAVTRGNPMRGCIELSMRSGDTTDFEVAFAVSGKLNVTRFDVYVSYLDPFPLF